MRTLIYLSALFVLITVISVTPIGAVSDSERYAEQQAWDAVDLVESWSIQDYLKQYPSGENSDKARLFLGMHDKMIAIKGHNEEPQLIIPISELEPAWSLFTTRLGESWYKGNGHGHEMPKDFLEKWNSILKGPAGSFGRGLTDIVIKINSDGSTSSSAEHQLTTFEGDQSHITMIRYGWGEYQDDQGGYPVFTGDGSIFSVQTSGTVYKWVSDITLQTLSKDPMYFGVIDGVGLVYLYGEGKVTLSEGKEVALTGGLGSQK